MTIRESIWTDKDIIVGFQQKMAMESEGLELDIKKLECGVSAVYQDKNKGVYYVAEDNGKIIASLLTTYEWSDWRNGTVLWIQSVYVVPEFRGKGVYSSMYSFLQEMVINEPNLLGLRLYVEKNNKIAQKVYEKTGMDGEHYRMYEWFC